MKNLETSINFINSKMEIINKIKYSLSVDVYLDEGEFETLFSELENGLPPNFLHAFQISSSAFSGHITCLKNALNSKRSESIAHAKDNLGIFLDYILSILQSDGAHEKCRVCYVDGKEPILYI